MNINSAYPARGEIHPVTITFAGYEYDGDGIIDAFSVDCIFDAAIRVNISLTFTGAVAITAVP